MNDKKNRSNRDSKFKELFGHFPKYLNYMDESMLEKLNCQLTTFNLAMERVGASKGYDPLPIKEAAELSNFWYDIKTNIRVLMEMHEFMLSELEGREYDTSKPGRHLWWKSLEAVSKEMEGKS